MKEDPALNLDYTVKIVLEFSFVMQYPFVLRCIIRINVSNIVIQMYQWKNCNWFE